jgi:hypothetical protein
MEQDEQQQSKQPRRRRRVSITLVPLVLLGGLALAACVPPPPPQLPTPSCILYVNAAGYPLINFGGELTNPSGLTATLKRQDGNVLFTGAVYSHDRPTRLPYVEDDISSGWPYPFVPSYYLEIAGVRTCDGLAPVAGCSLTVSLSSGFAGTVFDVSVVTNRPNTTIDYALVDGATNPAGSETSTSDSLGGDSFVIDSNVLPPDTYDLFAIVNLSPCGGSFTVT